MKSPRTSYCRLCVLNARFFESDGRDYVDCQRDNEDTKNRYLHNPNKDDSDLWVIQQVTLGKCPFYELKTWQEKGRYILPQ